MFFLLTYSSIAQTLPLLTQDSTIGTPSVSEKQYSIVLSAVAGTGFEFTSDIGIRGGLLFSNNVYAGIIASYHSFIFKGDAAPTILRLLFTGLELGYEFRLKRSSVLVRPYIAGGLQGIGHDALSNGTARLTAFKEHPIITFGGGVVIGYKPITDLLVALEIRAVEPMPIIPAIHLSYYF